MAGSKVFGGASPEPRFLRVSLPQPWRALGPFAQAVSDEDIEGFALLDHDPRLLFDATHGCIQHRKHGFVKKSPQAFICTSPKTEEKPGQKVSSCKYPQSSNAVGELSLQNKNRSLLSHLRD